MSKKTTKGVAVMTGKAKNETQEKFEFVKDLMVVKSYRPRDITQAYIEKYGDSDRAARKYMKQVRDALQDTQSDKLGYHMQVVLARLADLYQKNYEEQNYKECRELMKDYVKITGLDVKRIEVNTNHTETKVDVNDLLMQLPPDAVAAMVAKMRNSKQPPTIDLT